MSALAQMARAIRIGGAVQSLSIPQVPIWLRALCRGPHSPPSCSALSGSSDAAGAGAGCSALSSRASERAASTVPPMTECLTRDFGRRGPSR